MDFHKGINHITNLVSQLSVESLDKNSDSTRCVDLKEFKSTIFSLQYDVKRLNFEVKNEGKGGGMFIRNAEYKLKALKDFPLKTELKPEIVRATKLLGLLEGPANELDNRAQSRSDLHDIVMELCGGQNPERNLFFNSNCKAYIDCDDAEKLIYDYGWIEQLVNAPINDFNGLLWLSRCAKEHPRLMSAKDFSVLNSYLGGVIKFGTLD